MCTAVSYKTNDHYFGRNLDYDFSYQQSVTVTPRNYSFKFIHEVDLPSHFAIIGMAYVVDGYPLYYDATNEKGLSMAGLNFVGNAKYRPFRFGMYNIAPYEFIPWVLSRCENTIQAKELLKNTNIIPQGFNEQLPVAELHWMICDSDTSIIVEPDINGLLIHDDPIGVLTNNPPFDYQLFSLNNFCSLSPHEPVNRFSDKIKLERYSRGLGAMGLPGDSSSQSRYVKAAFTKLNSVSSESESDSISQFFHILGSVEQIRGCVRLNDGYEITLYSSCCNTDKGIYYYKTYKNSRISAVYMHNENLNSNDLKSFALIAEQQIFCHN
ncbi:MAG: choloylglycine hydrolase family protein [Ruminococcaceae bacterium]|nr:choloylglycine hydrolase family protein [Oscillospiraceae bacterium]